MEALPLKNNLFILTDDKHIYRRAKAFFAGYGYTVTALVYITLKNGALHHRLSDIPGFSYADTVLIAKNGRLQGLTKALHQQGIYDLYVYPHDRFAKKNPTLPSPEQLLHIDNKKPRLNFMDVEISGHCNLHCKGCLDFSNIVKEKQFLDIDLYEKNLRKLKEFFWGIAMIHLQGGEPLANPAFLDYVKITHTIFPDCDIRIVTNGLLIPTIETTRLRDLADYNGAINITRYPALKKIRRNIKHRLDDAGVVYSMTLPRYVFAKKILSKPHRHPDIAYKHCLIKHCTGMQGEYISPCMFPLHIHKLNSAFGLALPDTDKREISALDMDGWELLEILENQPIDFCRYCHYGVVPFLWKQQRPTEAGPEDWLVMPGIINSKILPFFYRFGGGFLYKVYKSFSGSEGNYSK